MLSCGRNSRQDQDLPIFEHQQSLNFLLNFHHRILITEYSASQFFCSIFFCPLSYRVCSLSVSASNLIYCKFNSCCVFRPANGCSACHSLVEIDFLMLKQLFPSLTEQINKNGRKASQNHAKHAVNKGEHSVQVLLFKAGCHPKAGRLLRKNAKSCFRVKKLISTSKRCAEHPFAGRNTQQIVYCIFYEYDIMITVNNKQKKDKVSDMNTLVDSL